MGKIKRIQLRGISRTPSDRTTEDGGVAESLNTYLDAGEVAPVLEPKDITSDLGIPDIKDVEKVFIHKTLTRENYIIISSTDVGYYEDGQFVSIFPLNGEQFMDIASVGNSLIVVTDMRMHFALFYEGRYKYLGTEIPVPMVMFECVHSYATDMPFGSVTLFNNRDGDDPAGTKPDAVRALDVDVWTQAIDDIKYGISNDNVSEVLSIHNELWSLINEKAKEIRREDKALFAPVFVRYAYRLYDGSYIHQSVPLMLGAGYDSFLDISAHKETFGDQVMTSIDFTLPNAFKVKAYPQAYNVTAWSDIVKSLDIFISTDVCYPTFNANFSRIEITKEIIGETVPGTSSSYNQYEYGVHFDQGGLNDREALEQEVLGKRNFYKIVSFPVDEISKNQGYDLVAEDAVPYSQDDLLLRERLPDYEQNNFLIAPSALFSYNNRLFAVGDRKALPDTYYGLQSLNIKWDRFPETTYETYAFAYYIRDREGNEHKVVMPSYYGEYAIDGEVARPYGLIFHPDARCFKVEILNEGDVYSVDMKPHPFLNCSYGYWGLSKRIKDLEPVRTGVTDEEFFSGENRYEGDRGRLYQSAADNPFYFPLAGNNFFSAMILGLATATTALSQGQFGQFPLYVFTEDGIWAMETASDGSLVSSKPLSREVCSNPASITPIDQAVLFMSDKGLMLLQGSQISELSPYMNGKHYTINESAKVIISGQPQFSGLIDAVTDSTPFMTFMKDAEIGYDYQGKRIICFNRNEMYQYVYKLDTNTWHKIYHSSAITDASPLNSYPRCEVVAKSITGYSRIIDYSTSLERSDDRRAERGVIATRPFDLDEPDVLKTITDVRVRGQFAPGAYRFILQGSMDNITWYTISTLRGKAWKMFRIILLTDLDVHERISWIDIMYDSRFTNRLR